jgi:hypothetical protein
MCLRRVFSVKPDHRRMRRSVPMPPVILINLFEVPEDKDEAFLAEWETVESFQTALNHPEFTKLREATPCAHFPAVYEVIRT